MTSEQIQYILEMALRDEQDLRDLAEVFPEVDWLQAEVERREILAARPIPVPVEPRSGAITIAHLDAALKDTYNGSVTSHVTSTSVFYTLMNSTSTSAGTYGGIIRSTEPIFRKI